MEEHDWLTPTQAAKFAKRARRTIYNWIKAGKVVTAQAPMGNVVVDKNSIYRITSISNNVQSE